MHAGVPGEGRYARLEREQRWVLSGLPAGLNSPVAIEDRYIAGTRLRLRRMELGPVVIYKLAQKVREGPLSPEVVKLTNMYLSEEEFAAFSVLSAAVIVKTRWRGTLAGRAMAVDELSGSLSGLCLAEVELAAGEPRLGAGPEGAAADVTDDDRFSGGGLARATPEEARQLLVYVASLAGHLGGTVGPPSP